VLRGLAAALVAAVAVSVSVSPRAVAGQDIAITARVQTVAGPTGIGFGHGLLWVTRDDDTVARVDPKSGHILGRTHVGHFPVRVAVGERYASPTAPPTP